ncbi:MAG TPA: L-histidine N(alpha)-methyltransferase [Thermoanaerobaculia bacterium]|jgi:L-histidine N-alpha-methyltransferase|nr:L-histidine N(alpha)-methyltransferase [Thermoanaerobaculia bacterium]
MTAALVPLSSDARFRLLQAGVNAADFAHDVRTGLTAGRKWLPPRWFYDDLGSSLFDAICFLPEYYVMRAETEVLTSFRGEIAASISPQGHPPGGPQVRLVELGSGAARKTRILLDALTASNVTLEYAPVDVDAAMLERSARTLLADYARLHVTAVCADFTSPAIPLRTLGPRRGRTVVLFLGSTIGNFDPDAAIAMLSELRASLAPGDALLLGADLRKSRTILEPAYADALGVTAAFNLNLLARINRELGGAFALDAFRHHAFYDEAQGRMEMHLVSTRAQRVRIDAIESEIEFAEGETIHTESSYKHDAATLAALAAAAGFRIERQWTDARGWFADVLMVV